MTFVILFAVITIAYGAILTLALVGWSRLSYFKTSKAETHTTRVSIVIAARNEAQTIVPCLRELVQQNYPLELVEIIVVDDASDDGTLAMAAQFLENQPVKVVTIRKEQHAGKKRCMAEAIAAAQGELIITSDADVFGRSSLWLRTIVAYYTETRAPFIILPLSFAEGDSVLAKFQLTENMALTGITAGYAGLRAPFLCNGANLAFSKAVYEAVGGYEAHLHISSGEDVLLMESVRRRIGPKAIRYLFSRQAIARTYYMTDLRALFQQRLRWTYKTKYNPNKLNALAGFVVVAANLLIPAFVVGLLRSSPWVPYLAIFVMAKVVFDFLLLFLASDFLGIRRMLLFLIPFECIYWIYAAGIGLASLVMKPKWKNRAVN